MIIRRNDESAPLPYVHRGLSLLKPDCFSSRLRQAQPTVCIQQGLIYLAGDKIFHDNSQSLKNVFKREVRSRRSLIQLYDFSFGLRQAESADTVVLKLSESAI